MGIPRWSILLLALLLLVGACADKEKKRKKAEAQVALGIEHYDEKDYPMALQACLDAQEADANYPESYNCFGLIYLAQRRYTEAIENFRQALDRNPDLSNARVNLGISLAAIGRLDEAIEEFEKALKNDLYRNPHVALLNLCEAYLRKGERSKAIDYCKRAIERNRTSCVAYYNLGRAYSELSQTRNDIEEMTLALKYCPNWTAPALRRAEARIKLKQFPQACNDLWDVIEADPEAAEAQRARRYTERIKCKPRPTPGREKSPESNPRLTPQDIPYAR